MKVRIVQMDIGQDVHQNVERAMRLATRAPTDDVDAIVFPELFTTGYQLPRIGQIAHKPENEVFATFRRLAKEHSVNLVLGSVALARPDGVYNTSFVIDRGGNTISEYSKIHLFEVMDEKKYLRPGSRPHVFRLDGVTMSSIICYDLRFPELTRNLFVKFQPEVVFVPMEWPAPRTNVFRTLVRARAIENQCFVVSANRVGSENGVSFEGFSLISDPYGNIVAELPFEEGIVDAKLDFDLIKTARRSISCLADRRAEVYADI